MDVYKRAGFKNDLVYVDRLNAQSAAPLAYTFATRFLTDCALSRSAFNHCNTVYRPGGALVNQETALRLSDPFFNKRPNNFRYERGVVREKPFDDPLRYGRRC